MFTRKAGKTKDGTDGEESARRDRTSWTGGGGMTDKRASKHTGSGQKTKKLARVEGKKNSGRERRDVAYALLALIGEGATIRGRHLLY